MNTGTINLHEQKENITKAPITSTNSNSVY